MAVVPLCSKHFVDKDFKEIPKIILSADLTSFTWTNLQADSEHLQINSVRSNRLFQTQIGKQYTLYIVDCERLRNIHFHRQHQEEQEHEKC